MNHPGPYRALTLAVHPNSRGFAWVAFSSPLSVYDWGIVGTPGTEKNAKCLRKVEELFAKLTPETLVLEAFERRDSIRHDRTAKLGRALVAFAAAEGIDVAVCSFKDVQQCFNSVGAQTRQEIAEAVARQISAFQHLLPKKRRAWDAESRRMPLFSAAAVALTHYQRDAASLLGDLASP